MLRYNNYFTTFNAGREYSYLKCTIAMQDEYSGKGALQVRADESVIYTSDEITNMTEPYEIEIPINQASLISIGTIGDEYNGRILVSNAVLYNQEYVRYRKKPCLWTWFLSISDIFRNNMA